MPRFYFAARAAGELQRGLPERQLLLPAGLSELILSLSTLYWLLIIGVDVPKWHLWSVRSEPEPMPQMR